MTRQASPSEIVSGAPGADVGPGPTPAVHLFNLHTRQNLGDAAIAQGAARLVGEMWPRARLTAASRYQADREWLRSLGALPVDPAISFPGPGDAPAPARILSFVGSGARFRITGRSAIGEDAPDVALSNGGGYLFSRREPELSFRHVLLEIEAMAAACPTFLLPQTVGPLSRERDRRAVRRSLREVRHLFVRDRASLDVALGALGLERERVSVAPDLVFALARTPRIPQSSPERPRVAMTVLDWRWAGGSDSSYESYLEAMAATALELLNRGCHLDLCVQVDMKGKKGHDDMAVAVEVRDRLDHPEAVEVSTAGSEPEEAIERYGSYDLVIGSRLHSALMGLCAGTPSIAVAYQPKATWIYEDLGFPEWAHEARRLRADDLISTATEILASAPAAVERLERATTGMRDELRECLRGVLEPWLGPAAPRDGS